MESSLNDLLGLANCISVLLTRRQESIAIAESSTGGLITASLVAVPGASSYCVGAVVPYTRIVWSGFRGMNDGVFADHRPATEPNALIRAGLIRDRFGSSWGLAETGAAGPVGNRYGDPPGHTCIAVFGPRKRTLTLRTGSISRVSNMFAFAAGALNLFVDVLGEMEE